MLEVIFKKVQSQKIEQRKFNQTFHGFHFLNLKSKLHFQFEIF